MMGLITKVQNFTKTYGVQTRPPPRTNFKELYEALSEYTHTTKHDVLSSTGSKHMFQKAYSTAQLSGHHSIQGGCARRYTAVTDTPFCRLKWPLWEMVSCLEQTYSSKHPIANIRLTQAIIDMARKGSDLKSELDG